MKQTVWIHPATFTYRFDQPEKLLETLWCERPGWGYLKRRDMWVKRETTEEDLKAAGFEPRKPLDDSDVRTCPFCGLYMSSIPGSLAEKHKSQCGGSSEDWQKLEEQMIQDQRTLRYERQIVERKQREKEESEAQEKRDRQDKIKEEMQARQLSKDRKKKMKQETKDDWKNRKSV
jgi:hypothetical protein